MRLMWPVRSAHASTTSRDRSVEPPSTQMCSISKLRCCSETDTNVSSIVASALSDTVMMEMNGFMIRGRPRQAQTSTFGKQKVGLNGPPETRHTTDLRRTLG